MFDYVKKVTINYVRDHGIKMEIDKRVVTQDIIDTLTNEHLEEITSNYD